jgi:phage shock protein C
MCGVVTADDHEDMTTPTPTKKLRRSSTDRMLAGVCGGWAEMLGVDAAILRIVFVAATIFGVGAPALLYAVCWILMPEDTHDA